MMEFLEYYQIIRKRIWLALIMALAGFAAVTVYWMLPSKQWFAEGSMVKSAGADTQLMQAGNQATVQTDKEVWGTIQVTLQSRAVLERAAAELARRVTEQEDGFDKVRPPTAQELLVMPTFEYLRPKKGDVFVVRGPGNTAAQAEALTQVGMEVFATLWGEWRIASAQAIRDNLAATRKEQAVRIAAIQKDMDRQLPGMLAGRPTDMLVYAQTRIGQLEGALASAKIDVGVNKDRLMALLPLARREAALPPEQRSTPATTPAVVSAAAPETRLLQAEADRERMILDGRTESHPAVQALDKEIESLRRRVRRNAPEEKRKPPSDALLSLSPIQQQVMMTKLDLRQAHLRVSALAAEMNELNRQLPALQKRAREYEELQTALTNEIAAGNAIEQSLATVDAEIGRLKKGKDLRIQDPAKALPSEKTASKYVSTAVLASFVGLLMGCLLSFGLHYLDQTFRTEAEAARWFGYPILTGIPRARRRGEARDDEEGAL